ncbi:MAG: hypothetical protein M8349_07525, partial [ANME-2 cluster archaeon]|nr:hypothetical protein [ANME-2 cluster archaeon]
MRIITKFKTIEGEAVGIDHYGALVVEMEDGTLEKEITGSCVHYDGHDDLCNQIMGNGPGVESCQYVEEKAFELYIYQPPSPPLFPGARP